MSTACVKKCNGTGCDIPSCRQTRWRCSFSFDARTTRPKLPKAPVRRLRRQHLRQWLQCLLQADRNCEYKEEYGLIRISDRKTKKIIAGLRHVLLPPELPDPLFPPSAMAVTSVEPSLSVLVTVLSIEIKIDYISNASTPPRPTELLPTESFLLKPEKQAR
jgi:hypothetical protein